MNIFMITFSVIMVGLSGLEPPTSRLSGARSNLLSYKPISPGVIRFLHPALHSLSNVVLVEMMGFEPMTPCLQGRCSPNWATPPLVCLFFTFAMNIEEFDNPSKLNNKRRVRFESRRPWLIIYFRITQNSIEFCQFSIERRWSSRTFRYGYLVTT